MDKQIEKFSDTQLKVPKPQEYEYVSIEDLEIRKKGKLEIITRNNNQNQQLEAEIVEIDALLDKASEFDLQPINNVFKKEE